MTNNQNDYLVAKLDEYRIKKTDDEAATLQLKRQEVEKLLRKAFGAKPTIKYGGSHAKGTMVRVSYDLDILCYFDHDDTSAGASLEGIYESVKTALSGKFHIVPKKSALRLGGKKGEEDFHIDVVPGRYVDDKKDDVFLHQNEGDKARLKTNPDVHIGHVRNSGHADIVCMLKVWVHRYNIEVKTFVLELAALDALEGTQKKTVEGRLSKVMKRFRDEIDELTVADPANPTGNDLSDFWSKSVRRDLRATARQTLITVQQKGWEAVFGALSESDSRKGGSAVADAVKQVSSPTRPWRR